MPAELRAGPIRALGGSGAPSRSPTPAPGFGRVALVRGEIGALAGTRSRRVCSLCVEQTRSACLSLSPRRFFPLSPAQITSLLPRPQRCRRSRRASRPLLSPLSPSLLWHGLAVSMVSYPARALPHLCHGPLADLLNHVSRHRQRPRPTVAVTAFPPLRRDACGPASIRSACKLGGAGQASQARGRQAGQARPVVAGQPRRESRTPQASPRGDVRP